jgi:hypothetical protein
MRASSRSSTCVVSLSEGGASMLSIYVYMYIYMGWGTRCSA